LSRSLDGRIATASKEFFGIDLSLMCHGKRNFRVRPQGHRFLLAKKTVTLAPEFSSRWSYQQVQSATIGQLPGLGCGLGLADGKVG
jgi:hypothetical protein